MRYEKLDFDELRLILFSQIHLLSYLAPLVVFIPSNPTFTVSFVRYARYTTIALLVVYTWFGIIIYPDNNFTDLVINNSLLPVAGFCAIWYRSDKKKRYLFLFGVLYCLYATVTHGRRTGLITTLIMLLSSYYITLSFSYRNAAQKRVISVIFTLIFALVVYINFDFSRISAFEALYNRIDEDSRSDVFFYYLRDMEPVDWVIGRGIDGKYYNPITYWDFTGQEGKDVLYRDTIENGFLYIILKQGIVGLVLFLFILIPAFFRSVFSDDILKRSCGIYILIYIITMFGFGQPAFTANYILLWVCIGYAFLNNKKIVQ